MEHYPLSRRMEALALALGLLFLPVSAYAGGEGDPLLSVDDLISLQESLETFLSEMEELIVRRGLLAEEDRAAWRDAQLGDFLQNGGYGSVLVNYMPGVLRYVREEETLLMLRASLENGSLLEISTMRRYTPQDSTLPGLMLTPILMDANGLPQDVIYTLNVTNGVFLKWDALTNAYVSVGTSAVSDGETIVWSAQTPLPDAQSPIISIGLLDPKTQEPLAGAALTLTVAGDGYQLREDALSGTTMP